MKLNRANAVLCKVREYVSSSTLKSIYSAIFDSHLGYANLIWGQNINAIKRLLFTKSIKSNELQTKKLSHLSSTFELKHFKTT